MTYYNPATIPKCFSVKAMLDFLHKFISFWDENIDFQGVHIFSVFQFERPRYFKYFVYTLNQVEKDALFKVWFF